jgi:hypothetical protein
MSESRLLEIATALLAGMPSIAAATMTDEEAAQWALRRAEALLNAYAALRIP